MPIDLANFNLGGIADSQYQGVANSMTELVGINIHSEPGIVTANQKMTKESGATVTDLVKTIVTCSDGKSYLFGNAGKVYSRTSAGVYALEATLSGAILGACEFGGFVYYALAATLGRWQIGTAWSTHSDSWGTFTNGDTAYHPMHAQNLVLYIGDKNYVAQVEGAVFSANALDLETQYRIVSLGQIGNDLAIGTYVASNVAKTQIFRWNTWSTSFSSSDAIPEIGINSFLSMDNFVLVNAGTKGNLYSYNGETLDRFKRIPGTWSGSTSMMVYPDASDNFFGLPLFGLSNISGNPAKSGVYSYGSVANNYPAVLNLEYLCSENVEVDIEFGSVKVVGTDLLVSWKHGSSYGVDKLDTSAKANGSYMTTRIISPERTKDKQGRFFIFYRSIPTGTSFSLKVSKNYEAYTDVTLVVDADKNLVYSKEYIPGGTTLKFKVILNTTANLSPELESLTFEINGK